MTFPNKGDIPKRQKDLYKLVGETYDKMKFIHENYDEEHLGEIQTAHQEIYGTKGVEGKYEGGKIQELQEAYHELLVDDEENQEYGIKKQIENLLEELQEEKIKKIDDFIDKVSGKFQENESGDRIKIEEGMFDKINKQIDENEKLYEEYDKKLQGASTSLELAKTFSDRVKSFYRAGVFWNGLFLILIGWLVFLAAESVKNIALEYKDVYLHLLLHLPFLIFGVWGLIFIGNRRAEAKKLEESYKHKEVMARAYIGYKRSIETLDSKDNMLLETHMGNLLEAMKRDSSEFLSTKGESHPLIDILNNFSKKDLKELLPDSDISFPWGKINFKK